MRDPKHLRQHVCHVVGGRTGGNAVVVLWILLCFLQPLTAASRAAVPVRRSRGLAVVRADERLGLDGHFVHGPVRKIDELLRMAKREAAIAPGVSSVSRRNR